MKKFIPLLLGTLSFIFSCQQHSAYWELLSQIETKIEAAPDSALFILEHINRNNLCGKKELGKYALLLSIAYDKNDIDTTSFCILQPAIDYYSVHGSITEKMRTLYYQGCIYYNRGDFKSALICYADALSIGEESEDLLTKARISVARSSIYKTLFDLEKYISGNIKAAEYFKVAGNIDSYANCLGRIINGYTLIGDEDKAIEFIKEAETIFSNISDSQKGTLYAAIITHLAETGSPPSIEKIEATINEYINSVPKESIEWLTIANAYYTTKEYGRAFDAIFHYKPETKSIEETIKYYALLALLYQHTGQFEQAIENYDAYLSVREHEELESQTHDFRFAEERHDLELQVTKEKFKKHRTLLISVAIILILVLLVNLSLARNIISMRGKEKYRILYEQLQNERVRLLIALEKNNELAKESRNVIAGRIEILNNFFRSYVTQTSNMQIEKIKRFMSDTSAFTSSIRQTFSITHPKFITHLETNNLTKEEIECCCLYAIGLRGKEIVNYMKRPGHYKESSRIRAKLGLNEHDPNLSNYINTLLNL